MTKFDYREYIENHTMKCEAGYRGGGIEIELDELMGLEGGEGVFTMTAYQNYLGGGMLGAICNSYNFDQENMADFMTPERCRAIDEVTDALNRYFHNLTNHEDDEWESTDYERGQLRPESAY